MSQLIYQCAQSQNVAEQHKLILVVCALFPSAGKEFDDFCPLRMGERCISGERMKVRHERSD